MANSDQDIDRSGRFILSFQLQSTQNALQTVLQSNQAVGPSTVQAVRKLRNDFLIMVMGPCTEDIPEVGEDATVADLYTITAFMNGTVDAFGTPEETEEKKRFFGYDRLDLAVGPFKVGLGQPGK